MPKIICAIENASELISGVKFVPVEGTPILVSQDEVPEPLASVFLSIPGYSLFVEQGGLDGEDHEDNDSLPGADAGAPEHASELDRGREFEDTHNRGPERPAAAPKKETAAERKARLKAEQGAKEVADREEVHCKADEPGSAGGATDDTDTDDAVF